MNRGTLLFAALCCSGAAAYDSDALMDAAGAYIAAADTHHKLTKGVCGFVARAPAPSRQARIAEVSAALNPADRKELNDYIGSAQFKVQMERNQLVLDNLYKKFKGGNSHETACGLLWGVTLAKNREVELKWARARAR